MKVIHYRLTKINILKISLFLSCFFLIGCSYPDINNNTRQRVLINDGWKFYKYQSMDDVDTLIYDIRPSVKEFIDDKDADTKPTEARSIESRQTVLKPWIMPSVNDFIKDPRHRYKRPDGNPGNDFPFVRSDFDDRQWEEVTLPHDWAIAGPFYEGANPVVGGGMGRLPSDGVAWYRKKLNIPEQDIGKSIFLEVDGAMSYAMVWLNGNLVGGWPYGYSSWQLDLTPYIVPGKDNQLAIRLDNPNYSSRWYTGGGLYRNVWLTKVNPVHICQWGTFITVDEVTEKSARIDINISIENDSDKEAELKTITKIFCLNEDGNRQGNAVAIFSSTDTIISACDNKKINVSGTVKNPKLWGPRPTQVPNLYCAVTTLIQNGKPVDDFETTFGIRSLKFNPDSGVYINDELVKIKGVNNHHDLGAIGAAFNIRAAERQLEILQEMGCNAVRMAHNPPAPELLELTDKMGILVMDESFDCWELKKNPHDFHLIFPEWYEQDLRSMIRRDRNHPSIIIWSVGNEVGEQYTGEDGATLAQKLCEIVKEEDPTRPTTTAMNWAKSYMPLPATVDIISLNYQGEGIRQSPEFEGTDRIRTAPQYKIYHKTLPDKMIIESESASAASSRGIYLFPVTDKISDIIRDGRGGDPKIHQVTSYELHAVDFGASVDKVFATIDKHPFVAGEFVWNGFDYIGEPTPYYSARSSYTGIIDLAGFKKDRFYLYQSHWRPELPTVHILPHWNWPDRIGEITPVHVFTSGDAVELFLNGKSLGRKQKGEYEYRLRWDDVRYEPGELKAVAYKDGKNWAEESVKTTGKPAALSLTADRNTIFANGSDLSFITVKVVDDEGLTIPTATNLIHFEIEGSGEIIATDNGDPTNFVPFPSHERAAFSGLALAIVRSISAQPGPINVTAQSSGLGKSEIVIQSQ